MVEFWVWTEGGMVESLEGFNLVLVDFGIDLGGMSL